MGGDGVSLERNFRVLIGLIILKEIEKEIGQSIACYRRMDMLCCGFGTQKSRRTHPAPFEEFEMHSRRIVQVHHSYHGYTDEQSWLVL